MKTILVTGGCGFIGSNFINYYYAIHKHVRIVNIDALYYCASEENISSDIRSDKDRYSFYNIDLSAKFIDDILRIYDVEAVVHFAAQSHV